jgi:hypothetical protein
MYSLTVLTLKLKINRSTLALLYLKPALRRIVLRLLRDFHENNPRIAKSLGMNICSYSISYFFTFFAKTAWRISKWFKYTETQPIDR